MTLSLAFFTFLNAFWLMAFIAIPFCVQYEEESENIPANEKYVAAPKSINWKKAFKIATILAVLVTIGIAVIIRMIR